MSRLTDEELDERLSEPTEAVDDCLRRFPGDLIVLGAGGKMGPSLCRMVRRAADLVSSDRRIIAVSRFQNLSAMKQLEGWGIETIRGDLLDRAFVSTLPQCPLVISMSGQKFGTSGAEARTWATNAYLPAIVCERFASSRIVAFSTGNVYGLVLVSLGSGSVETDALDSVGEYAMSCVGRERMYEYFSRENGTSVSIIRLNYACELRYGLLVDIARRVLERQLISLEMGYTNVIWQADANAMALASLALAKSPPFVLNVAGPELLRCRDVATRFGELFDVPVTFAGAESPNALLSDASQAFQLCGRPRVGADELVQWIADWIRGGGQLWDKPTHYESLDGKF